MKQSSLRMIEAVLSTCQTEEETQQDMNLLRAVVELHEEAEKRWTLVYAAAYTYHTKSGREAQLQLRITKDPEDFFKVYKNEDSTIL